MLSGMQNITPVLSEQPRQPLPACLVQGQSSIKTAPDQTSLLAPPVGTAFSPRSAPSLNEACGFMDEGEDRVGQSPGGSTTELAGFQLPSFPAEEPS